MEDNSELQSELVNIKMPKEEINKLEVDGISKNSTFSFTLLFLYIFYWRK